MPGQGAAAGGRAGEAGEGGGRSCWCRARGDWSFPGAEMRLQVLPRVGEGGTREPSSTVKGQQQERLGSSSWEELRPLGGTVPSGRDVRRAGASGLEADGWSCQKVKAEEVGHQRGAEPLP